MRWIEIELTNIGPYAHEKFDLTSIQSATVVGETGAGKSTLFVTGPLWILTGECDVPNPNDNLMRLGETEMSGALTWKQDNQTYRVVRSRSKKSKAGRSELSLQIFSGEGWSSCGGSGLRETQEKINHLLSADYHMITSTSILVQGQAAKFSQASPTQRKTLLASILRCDHYHELRQVARTHATRIDQSLIGKRELVGQCREIADKREGLQEKIDDLATQLESLNVALVESGIRRTKLVEEQTALSQKLGELASLDSLITEGHQSIESLNSQHQETNRRKERLTKIVANATVVREKEKEESETKKRLVELRAEVVNLEEKIAELTQKKSETVAHQEQLAKVLESLQADDDTRSEVNNLQVTMEAGNRSVDELIWKVTNAQKEKEELGSSQARIEELKREASLLNTQFIEVVNSYRNQTGQLERDILAKTKSIALLEQVPFESNCERCQFTTSAVNDKATLPTLQQEFNARIQDIEAIKEHENGSGYSRLRSIEEELEGLDVESISDRLQAAIEQHTKLNSDLTYLQNEVKTGLERSEALAARLLAEEDRQNLAKDRQALESQSHGKTAEGWELELQPVRGDHKTKLDQEREGQESLEKLREYTKLIPELTQAETELPDLELTLTDLSAKISHKEMQVTVWQDKKKNEEPKLQAQIQTITDALQTLEQSEKTNKDQVGQLQQQKATLDTQLAASIEAATKAQDLGKDIESLTRDLRHYQWLVDAYEKIPIMIVENAIPVLELAANTTLERISLKGMRVRLETQKTLKSSDRLAETLDIIVRDVVGERIYECYSGGERYQIDLALRIGLAKLLANRAGARMETLVIDEGLGSLSPSCVAQVKHCLEMLEQEFSLVLVISHVEGIKGTFPHEIQVTNVSGESQVAVVG